MSCDGRIPLVYVQIAEWLFTNIWLPRGGWYSNEGRDKSKRTMKKRVGVDV